MKNIITICLFAFGVFIASAQKKKELLDKIIRLEKQLLEAEQNVSLSKEKEVLLNKKVEMTHLEVTDAREENTKLLKTINNFTSLSQQRVQNLTKSLETIKQKDAQLKVVNDALAKEEEEKIKQLNVFKDGLGTVGKVGYKKGILSIIIPNVELYGEGKAIELTEKGKLKIKKVGDLLTKYPEYSIIIEGNSNELDFIEGVVPRNNWDLSTLQASTIATLLLTESKIDPKRIDTAAKSKYNTDTVETVTCIKVKSNYEAFFNTIMEGMKE